MKRVAFTGGLIFNSNSETFVSANILCEDGYIKDITRDEVPYNYEIISVEGKYVIPGLVDVHTHGIGGYDFNYAKVFCQNQLYKYNHATLQFLF